MGSRIVTVVIDNRKWYDVMYSDYLLAPRAILYIKGRMENIESFEGESVRVRIDGTIKRYSMQEARRLRYKALSIRQTLCNHPNLDSKYKYDIRDYNCWTCFCSIYCNRNFQRLGDNPKLALLMRDLNKLSEFFEINKDLYE